MKQITIPISMLWSIVIALGGGTISLCTMVWKANDVKSELFYEIRAIKESNVYSRSVIEKLLKEAEETRDFKQFVLVRFNQVDGRFAAIDKKVDGLYGYSLVKKRKKDD